MILKSLYCKSLVLLLAHLATAIGVEPPQPEATQLDLVQLTRDGAFKHRPQWHPDGQRLAFARHEAGGNSIFIRVAKTVDFENPARLTRRNAPEYHATFSPDGKSVLLTVITLSGTQGNLDIAVMPTDGSAEPKTIAGDHQGKLSHQDWPAWLPDGKRFVMNSTHEGNQEIYLGSTDGSSELERLTQSPGQDVHPAVSTDGTFIIFATDRWEGMELARLDLADKKITRMTRSPGLDDYPAISPDGKRVAFVSNRSGHLDIWLGDLQGNAINLTQSKTPDNFPAFSPDGRRIVFLSGRHGETDLYSVKVPGVKDGSLRPPQPSGR